MTMNRSQKLAFLFIVPIFLAVGGAAGFFYVISTAIDPAVTQDINAHFAALEEASTVIPNDKPFTADTSPSPVYRLYAVNSNNPASEPSDSKTKKKPKKTRRYRGENRAAPVVGKPGITRIAPGTYLVEAAAIEDARANLRKYIGSALAELVEDKNGPVGFRLKNISNGSYLHAVGVRNKDILTAINGHPLSSIENVTLAIASFKNATQFRLDLLRDNKQRSLYYKVVE